MQIVELDSGGEGDLFAVKIRNGLGYAYLLLGFAAAAVLSAVFKPEWEFILFCGLMGLYMLYEIYAHSRKWDTVKVAVTTSSLRTTHELGTHGSDRVISLDPASKPTVEKKVLRSRGRQGRREVDIKYDVCYGDAVVVSRVNSHRAAKRIQERLAQAIAAADR